MSQLIKLGCAVAESRREQYLGPITNDSPDGFKFSHDTITALQMTIDLEEMISLVFRDLGILDRELRDTKGMLVHSPDYSHYKDNVRSMLDFFVNTLKDHVLRYMSLGDTIFCFMTLTLHAVRSQRCS